MDFKKVTILILIFYILALLETSFLVHFNIFLTRHLDWYPNLILIAVILLNLFEKPENSLGLFGAAVGGFFWDIFSTSPIGFHVLILTIIAILIKIILRKYVRLPVIKGF